MINHSAFFVRNAADYVDFQTASSPLRFFFPGFNPFHFRLHELFVARAITRQTVVNPLNIRYWSMTPYCFGAAAGKFSAQPAGFPSPFTATGSLDFLHVNLMRHLAEASASFDFMVQLRARPDAMPIEDPTIAWNEADAPFVPVASITIPAQSFDSPEQHAFCENLSFTPWHCVEAHRPLGGINRVRRTVYETISRLRHDLNGASRSEPTDFDSLVLSKERLGARPEEYRMSDWLSRHFFSAAGSVVDGWAWLSGEATATVINEVVGSTRNRPHPWSTASDYTSWQSLTDHTYLARHLPPVDVPSQPPETGVQRLVPAPARCGASILSKKSTCLFPAFAQYLTDGLIRTLPDRPAARRPPTTRSICARSMGATPGADRQALRLEETPPRVVAGN